MSVRRKQRRWIENCKWAEDRVHVTTSASITVKSGAFNGVVNRQMLLRMAGKSNEAAALEALADEQRKHIQKENDEVLILRFSDLSFVSFFVWDTERKPIAGRRFGTWYGVVLYSDQENDFIHAFRSKS